MSGTEGYIRTISKSAVILTLGFRIVNNFLSGAYVNSSGVVDEPKNNNNMNRSIGIVRFNYRYVYIVGYLWTEVQ